ncbi:MAG: peptidylprolyl isomerase [Clostridiales bacterium]|nr:peptidylprolyl isomerase [Clostridiales bacterium]
MAKKYYLSLLLTNDKKINLCLDESIAPLSVNQFINLVKKNYYDGTIFHRVIENFMIQTGGYKFTDDGLDSLGEEVPAIKGEFKSNGVENNLKHELGVISMARTAVKDSATSQFFICVNTCPWLDGEYAAFGKTTDEESNKVVLEISKMPTCRPHPAFSDFPVETIGIKTIELLKEE